MHHLSLFPSQLALLPGGKASAPPKIQRAQRNKEKFFCGFSSSNDWWSQSPPRRGWWSCRCSLAITPSDLLRTVPLPSRDNSGEAPDSTSQTACAKPDSKPLDLSFQFISCHGKIMALIMGMVQLSQTKQWVLSRTKQRHLSRGRVGNASTALKCLLTNLHPTSHFFSTYGGEKGNW